MGADEVTTSPASDDDDVYGPMDNSPGFDLVKAVRGRVTEAAREHVQHDCVVSGHLYDDDWPWPDQVDMRSLAPGSRVGDPCIWCDHEKGADG